MRSVPAARQGAGQNLEHISRRERRHPFCRINKKISILEICCLCGNRAAEGHFGGVPKILAPNPRPSIPLRPPVLFRECRPCIRAKGNMPYSNIGQDIPRFCPFSLTVISPASQALTACYQGKSAKRLLILEFRLMCDGPAGSWAGAVKLT